MVKAMNDPLTEALRTLPDPMPPEGLWDDIAQRLDRQRIAVRRAWPRAWFRVLPVAVLASAAALGIWLLLAPAPERPVGFLDPAIVALLMESQSLEARVRSRRLAASPTRGALLIRIADVDARLNDAWLADSGCRRTPAPDRFHDLLPGHRSPLYLLQEAGARSRSGRPRPRPLGKLDRMT